MTKGGWVRGIPQHGHTQLIRKAIGWTLHSHRHAQAIGCRWALPHLELLFEQARALDALPPFER